MEAVAHFLTNLRIAAKHTVSALKGVAHTGGRFLKEVEAATDYQFVALAPGSLRIGLARSAATVDASLPEGDFFEAQLLTDAIADASDRGELGIRAIRVLMRALEAAESEHALEDLRSELDDHGTLRVLYHARSLFPRGVETVEFSGRAIGASARFSTDAKDKLRRIGERLVQAERYVGGVGIVRMLDLDRRTLRLEFARIESLPELDTVNAEYGDDIDSPVSGTMGKPVRFSGSLRFDTKGVPQRLRIDSLNIVEASASADDLNVFVTA